MPDHIGRLHLRTENSFQAVYSNAFTVHFAGVYMHDVAIFQQLPIMLFQTACHIITGISQMTYRFSGSRTKHRGFCAAISCL